MATWEDILRAAFERLSSVKFTDGRAISRALCALTALLHQPALQHAMVSPTPTLALSQKCISVRAHHIEDDQRQRWAAVF